MKGIRRHPGFSVIVLISAFLLFFGAIPADSVSLEYVSSIVLNHFFDVCADEKYAYCTTSYGFGILKIYDPEYPNLTGSVYLRDSVYQLQNNGNCVYIANGNGGLKVIDVTDKYRPEVVGTCSTPGKVRAICVKDSLVYLGEDNSGIQIINVADPVSPYIVGGYDSPNSSFFAYNMVLKDSLIYAATEADCIEIINVKNPAAPAFVGNFCGATKPMSLAIVGDTMFVGDDAGDCLKIFDISDPVNPEFISSAPSNSSKPYQTVYGDGYVYMADYDGITAFDVTDIGNPVLSGEYATDYVGPSRLFLGKEYLYYTIQTYGFHAVTVKPPLTQKGRYVTPYYFSDIIITDTVAFLNIMYYGIVTADISDPAQPSWIGGATVHSVKPFAYMSYVNGYLYYTNLYFHIFDAGNPVKPFPVMTFVEYIDPNYPYISEPEKIYTYKNRAYVQYSSIQIFDISDPLNAHVVDSFAHGFGTHDFYIDTVMERAYLTSIGAHTLQIFDISDTTQVTHLGYCGLGAETMYADVYAKGNIAYVIRGRRIYTVDVSNPADPQVLNDYWILMENAWATDFFIEDTVAYIASDNHIFLYNVSDPAKPTLITYIDNPCTGWYVEQFIKRDEYLYLAGLDYFAILRVNFNNYSMVHLCGDANGDSEVNLTDVATLIYILYAGDVRPYNLAAVDFDNSGTINLLDITCLIRYLFKNGPEPECNL